MCIINLNPLPNLSLAKLDGSHPIPNKTKKPAGVRALSRPFDRMSAKQHSINCVLWKEPAISHPERQERYIVMLP